uniref:Polyprotein n=1 Tax=Mesocestoides corti TaxID=53468 RepID=A0A5K3EQ33_MESCO
SFPVERQSVEYPSPSRQEAGTIEQVLLINHKPEAYFRSRPSCTALMRICLWMAVYLPPRSFKRKETENRLRSTWPNMSAPLYVPTEDMTSWREH